MSKYIIDISHYHPVTDWAKAKEISHCLISKGTQGINFVDDTLKSFVAGCEKNKIPYWLYCFPERGIELESAQFFLKTVKPLIGKYFVGYALDVESYTKKVNGKKQTFFITNDGAIKAMKLLQAEGYKTMLYSGQSEYSTFKTAINACIGGNTAWWEARYGKNDGSYPDLNKYPIHDRCDLHQYCSTKVFSCFKGGVDISKVRQTPSGKNLDWYITPGKPKAATTTTKKVTSTTTKGGAATMKTDGRSEGKKLLCGAYTEYTPTGKSLFVNAGRWYTTPKQGDIVYFYSTSKGRVSHVGYVISVNTTDKTFKTIEGNTASDTITDNGGMVASHTYSYKYVGGKNKVNGFGRPKYGTDTCPMEHLLAVHKAELGYTEKNSSKYIGATDRLATETEKKQNSGSGNYTKYGAWYGDNGAYWCQQYQSWAGWYSCYAYQNGIKIPGVATTPTTTTTTKATTTTTSSTKKSYTGSFPTLPSRGYFKNGDISSEVIKVKKFLNWAIGAGLTETNKNYFDKTVAAVKAFQKKAGFSASQQDGEWGSKTQAAAKAFKK